MRLFSRRGHKAVNPRKKIGTMNLVLIVVGVLLVAFTVEMIITFRHVGAIPDTLVTCFYATIGGECGILGWIKTAKEKREAKKGAADATVIPAESASKPTTNDMPRNDL